MATTPATQAPAPAITLTRSEVAAVDAAADAAKALVASRAADDAAMLRLADKEGLEATDILPIGDLTDDLATLRTAWTAAHSNWAHAEKGRALAQHQKDVAAVWMARIAYRAASHEEVANKRYPYNITGAAKVLGMPVATLRPYAKAGEALGAEDRAGLLSEPDAEDITILNESFDAGTRQQQKDKRLNEKVKKAELEAKAEADKRRAEAAEAEAARLKAELEAANGGTAAPVAPATGDEAPAPAPAPEAPATGEQAPATAAPATEAPAPATAPAPEAPAPAEGPSLEEDTIATAKRLVAQVKRLQADKAWNGKKVAKEVVAILADIIPSLTK